MILSALLAFQPHGIDNSTEQTLSRFPYSSSGIIGSSFYLPRIGTNISLSNEPNEVEIPAESPACDKTPNRSADLIRIKLPRRSWATRSATTTRATTSMNSFLKLQSLAVESGSEPNKASIMKTVSSATSNERAA